MKVLLTGSTGYIGRRLLPLIVAKGCHVVCPVRDNRRFDFEDFSEDFLRHVTVVECDFNNLDSLSQLPKDIDVAYYLIHALASKDQDFKSLEQTSASNFASYVKTTNAKQIIYLGGIANDQQLSQHLDSRKGVESTLSESNVPLTVLRAGIIIGSGSASFEIIRDLVEKLPFMVAPKWIKTKCQPIGIANVLDYLVGVINEEKCYNRVFDIAGPDILTYKEMMLGYAKVRKLWRRIMIVPVLTPRLSSLWLYFVTSTSYFLARNLVDSMKNEVIAKDSDIDEILQLNNKLSYQEALQRAFTKIKQKQVESSWKDSFYSPEFNKLFIHQMEAPSFGCLLDHQEIEFNHDPELVARNIWKIGGENGWYYGNFLWQLRGFLDKMVGGVGLRRGRRDQFDIKNGDALDFWRVLYVNKEEQRLLLFAEMKLPGEAWLEFKIKKCGDHHKLLQTATFRPLGLMGRLYWYLVIPFHLFIFKNMAKRIAFNI
ncbi:MAG: SDR family oxidoreductase [bacterium]|nr:SDR family oxidoreductase [bacterium]